MAVDSRQKRMSMIEFGSGHAWRTLFEADGSVDADDRSHLLGLYSGIALDAPSVGGVPDFTPLWRPRRRG